MATSRGLRGSALFALLLCACTEGGQGSDDGTPRRDGAVPGGGTDGPTSASGNVPPFAACATFELFACCAWGCPSSTAWKDGEASCSERVRELDVLAWSGTEPAIHRCFRVRVEALRPEDSGWSLEHFVYEGPPSGALCGYLTREACDEVIACIEESDGERLVEMRLPSPGAECPAFMLQEPVGDDAGS